MRTKFIVLIVAFFFASVAATQAQTTLTAWTFDNLPIGINSSPQPSTGLGTASALGMNNGYNNTNSASNPDIQSLAGSSGGLNCWRIRGFNASGTARGNGWSTNAPIGTQGAQFTGSTYGYDKVKVSFDVNATSDAEAKFAGAIFHRRQSWFNANIASAAAGVIATNTTSANTVNGAYIQLASGWNNQVTVDLSGLSGADNNASFTVRLVNASTGPDCVDTTGAVYDNISGSWSFDNVVIQGTSIDTIADWDFDLIGVEAANNNPAPTSGSGTATPLGMANTYAFSGGTGASYNTSYTFCDILAQAGASTGANSLCWRVRGGYSAAGAPNSGWNSQAPIGTQGAEFDVDTSGYTNIVCNFDIYFTTQAPDEFFVEYTTDGWATTNIANSLFYGANPAYVLTNSSNPNLINGVYFYETFGQGWYNNVVVDLTGVPAAANNPLFGFRVVNAGTGPQCQNYLGGAYNNLSGNWRFDNVTVGGTSGTPAPAIAFDPKATVDNLFTNTYTDNPAWRTSISAIYVNGLILSSQAYTTTNCGRNHLQSLEILPPPEQRPVEHFHHFAWVWNGEGSPTACCRRGHQAGHHHPRWRPLGQQRHVDHQPRVSRFGPIWQWHHPSLPRCHDHCVCRRRRSVDFGWRRPTGLHQRPDRLHQLDSHAHRLVAHYQRLHNVLSGRLWCDLQHELTCFQDWSAAGSVHAGKLGRLPT